MDQDLRFQAALSGDTSGGSAYFAVPYRCTVRDIRGTLQASTGSTSAIDVTVTELTSSGSIGTVGFAASSGSLAAGAVGSFSRDNSGGSTILAANTVLKLDVLAAQVSGSFAAVVDIELDPYARTL